MHALLVLALTAVDVPTASTAEGAAEAAVDAYYTGLGNVAKACEVACVQTVLKEVEDVQVRLVESPTFGPIHAVVIRDGDQWLAEAVPDLAYDDDCGMMKCHSSKIRSIRVKRSGGATWVTFQLRTRIDYSEPTRVEKHRSTVVVGCRDGRCVEARAGDLWNDGSATVKGTTISIRDADGRHRERVTF